MIGIEAEMELIGIEASIGIEAEMELIGIEAEASKDGQRQRCARVSIRHLRPPPRVAAKRPMRQETDAAKRPMRAAGTGGGAAHR